MPRPHLRGKKRPVPKRNGPGRLITVQLSVRHTVNGAEYGPGDVRVREALARHLQHTEESIAAMERRFLEPRDALIDISYGYPRILPVRKGFFDQAVADVVSGNAAPALHLSGSAR